MNVVRTASLIIALGAACSGGAASKPPAGPRAAAGEPTLLVTVTAAELGPAYSFNLAGDDRHLFWTTELGIIAADRDGRNPRTVVPEVFVSDLKVVDGRLLYRSVESPTWSIPVDGGEPRPVERDDPAGWLAWEADLRAADGRGAVTAGSDGAALLVATADEPPRLILPRAAGHRWMTLPPVLIGDAILAADLDGNGDVGIWRLPRDPAGAPVLIDRAASEPRELVAAGGALYFIESAGSEPIDGVGVDRLVRLDADGHRTTLASTGGFVAVDADASGVVYATRSDDGDGDTTTVWLAEPGGKARELARDIGPELVGLALAPRAVFWIADGAIWTVPRAGGVPGRFHEPTWGDAGGSGRVHLVIDGSSVYFSSVGLGATGVHRTRGGAESTELWPPPDDGMSDDLVQVGGSLFVITGRRTVVRVPMSGAAAAPIYTPPDDAEVYAIAGGGGWLYVAVSAAASTSIIAIDPATGAATPFLHLTADRPALAADATALYLADGDTGWILRAPPPTGTGSGGLTP